MTDWILGRNPVYEVLRAKRRSIQDLLISDTAQKNGRIDDILNMSLNLGIQPSFVHREDLDSIGSHHQGVAVKTSKYPYTTANQILDNAFSRNEAPFILILDQVQDPQNLGTLMRTAEVVGVHGVILPSRRSASITPAVVSASSGASEHLLVTQANISQSIAKLKENDIWILGLEGTSEAKEPSEMNLEGPLAVVVGSEGKGMRSLVRKSCDFLLRLPMKGKIESLNAATAGSIALYLVWQARGYV